MSRDMVVWTWGEIGNEYSFSRCAKRSETNAVAEQPLS